VKIFDLALVLGLTTALAACGGGKSSDSAASGGNSASTGPGASSPPTAPVGPSAAPGTANCVYTADGSNSSDKKVELPPGVADTTKTYTATVVTNHGTIVIDLDAKAAPCTVNSFVSLAKQHFFDNTPCHRLLDVSQGGATDAVLQCGDPTGTGQGGPGYSFADENLAGATYPKGEVAMANSGPNTNGSQFFMIFKDSQFQPDYTPFGHITSGLDVITQIAAAGTTTAGGDGPPKTKTTIEKVTITSKGGSISSPTPTKTSKATKSPSPSASATAQ
jgi:peptidyl-prolyl cis-trans isomerase B (cyclophilin B)